MNAKDFHQRKVEIREDIKQLYMGLLWDFDTETREKFKKEVYSLWDRSDVDDQEMSMIMYFGRKGTVTIKMLENAPFIYYSIKQKGNTVLDGSIKSTSSLAKIINKAFS